MLEERVLAGEEAHLPSGQSPAAAPPHRPSQAIPPRPVLDVEVVWGDITAVEADLYAVGHYELVLPRNAELELDKMVSGPDAPAHALVLTNLTRRGVLRGSLGDVDFFPWASSSGSKARGRVVAVAGMGHPGSFGSLELRRLARNLAWAAEALPDVRTVCTVLIGSGGNNLPLAAAVDGLVAGLVDAVGPDTRRGQIRRLKIAEKELGKARGDSPPSAHPQGPARHHAPPRPADRPDERSGDRRERRRRPRLLHGTDHGSRGGRHAARRRRTGKAAGWTAGARVRSTRLS